MNQAIIFLILSVYFINNAELSLLEPTTQELDDFCLTKSTGMFSYDDEICLGFFVQCVCAHHMCYGYKMPCAANLIYDKDGGYCDYPTNVKCAEKVAENVCFGAKDDSFGSFSISKTGTIEKLILNHVSGYLTCGTAPTTLRSPFSCNFTFEDLVNKIGVWITNSDKEELYPNSVTRDFLGFYYLGGFNALSTRVKFDASNGESTQEVTDGEELQIWYGEDLFNSNDADNGGTSCVDVFIQYEH